MQSLRPVIWTRLPGLVPYKEALELQEGMVSSRLKARAMLADTSSQLTSDQRRDLQLLSDTDMVLFLQHAPVYTIGRRTNQEVNKEERERLQALGADYVLTKRGGLTTFHGPGQLMAYPIFDLAAMKVYLIVGFISV